jgi:lipoyl(octanoyl) transferase
MPVEGTRAAPLWVISYPEPQPYRALWDLQRRLWRQRYAGAIPDTLLLLEHEPVITLGKNARRQHVLLPEALLRKRGVDLVDVDRGGDVTYHGPGQLVGYWIFDLRLLYQDVHRFLREIEEVLLRVLARHGVEGGRDPGATGVWVSPAAPADGSPAGAAEKIAALGLHLSHWVSTHGFALNLAPDLASFSWIIPCGLAGRGVTSMERILGRPVPRAEVEPQVVEEVARLFRREPLWLRPLELDDILMTLERRSGISSAASAVPPGIEEQRSTECRA